MTEQHKQLRDQAGRLARKNKTAPLCHCGKRMLNDQFNGMWACRDEDHGGYQTFRQAEQLLYVELLRNAGLGEMK